MAECIKALLSAWVADALNGFETMRSHQQLYSLAWMKFNASPIYPMCRPDNRKPLALCDGGILLMMEEILNGILYSIL